MQLTREEVKLLALSQAEQHVLRTLESMRGGVALNALAEHLRRPRTTIRWTLEQLESRGLIAYAHHGRVKLWYSKLNESRLRKVIGSLESIAGEMKIYEGVSQMRELYRTALLLHREERVTIIEGKRAALTIAKKAGVSFIVDWHTVAYEKRIIQESIIGADTLQKLKTGTVDRQIIESLSRFELWVGYVVPDHLIDVDAAVLTFRDSLILADWSTERGVLVNNREIVSMMKNMIEIYVSIAQKVNLVQVVRAARTVAE